MMKPFKWFSLISNLNEEFIVMMMKKKIFFYNFFFNSIVFKIINK